MMKTESGDARQTTTGGVRALSRHNVRLLGLATGQPMMFAHGFGCDQNMWRFVAPAFEDRYRVVLYDLMGFGGSDTESYSSKRYSSLDAYADDVLEICSELDLRDVIFVGHSVSSMIGTLAAIKQPDRFHSLVMVGPSPRYIDDEEYVGGFKREDIDGLLVSLESNYLGWSAAMAPMIIGNPERPELGQELTASFCRADPMIARDFARVTFLSDNRKDLPRLKTRTLVLQCSDDIIAPDPVGEYVHANVVDSEFVKLDASGHCPNLSAPDETIAAIEEFLAGSRSA